MQLEALVLSPRLRHRLPNENGSSCFLCCRRHDTRTWSCGHAREPTRCSQPVATFQRTDECGSSSRCFEPELLQITEARQQRGPIFHRPDLILLALAILLARCFCPGDKNCQSALAKRLERRGEPHPTVSSRKLRKQAAEHPRTTREMDGEERRRLLQRTHMTKPRLTGGHACKCFSVALAKVLWSC